MNLPSFGDGLTRMTDAVKNVFAAPFRVAQGDGVDAMVDAATAPLEVKRGFLETATGAVTAPFAGIRRLLAQPSPHETALRHGESAPAGTTPSPQFVADRTGRIVG